MKTGRLRLPIGYRAFSPDILQVSRFVPLQSGWGAATIGLPDASAPVDGGLRKVCVKQVTARFFETLGIAVLLGRGFEEHDNGRVVVVNETFAAVGCMACERTQQPAASPRSASESHWAQTAA